MVRSRGKCVVNGVTVATLKVLAAFSPASLSFKQLSGDAYQVSVPITLIFMIIAFFMLTIRVVNIYLFFSVMCDKDIPNFTGISNLISIVFISWLMCLGLIITIIAILRARKQMSQQIYFISKIQKILSRFDLDPSLDTVFRKIKINLICSIFFLVTFTVLDITLSNVNQSRYYVKHTMFLVTLDVNHIVIIMVGMQYFVIISILLSTIKTIYCFLLQYINILIYNEGKTKVYSDKTVYIYRSHEEIRRCGTAFLSLCKMVKKINGSESILFVMILLFEVSDISCHIYYLASAIQLPGTYIRTKEIAIQVLWLTYMTARLFSRIEDGHLLNNELLRIKEILHKILHKMPRNSDHNEELNTLFEQVLLLQPRWAPLGIVTLNRTLITSIISGSITFLIILLQFKIKETYSI